MVGSSSLATSRVAWDGTNSKLIIFREDATSGIEAEAGSTSDQATVIVTVEVFGK